VAAGDDVVERVLSEVGARGADVVIEASGAPGQLANAIRIVRSGGSILQVGLPSTSPEIDVASIVIREVVIRTTNAHVYSQDLGPALELLQRTDLATELLDSVRPLDDIAGQLERLATGKLEGKVLFDPSLLPSPAA
jgi:(R,R)-butanediol dehydrogenase/meso-butanediol dehydrogenase/diacetyl reductase